MDSPDQSSPPNPWRKRTENLLLGVLASAIVAIVTLAVTRQWAEIGLLSFVVAAGCLVVAIFAAVVLMLLLIYSGVQRIYSVHRDELNSLQTENVQEAERQQKKFATAVDEVATGLTSVRETLQSAKEHSNSFYSLALNLVSNAISSSETVQIWSLDQLTVFEKQLPTPAEVVIDRPRAIATKCAEQLTSVMEANSKRGITYRAIGEKPAEWRAIANLEELHPSDDEAHLGGASLVLPSFGMVLYVLDEKRIKQIKGPKKNVWIDVHYPNYRSDLVHIRGFALVPYSDLDSEHAYFAIPLQKVDIDQVVRRIW